MGNSNWWLLDKEQLRYLIDHTPNGQEIYEQAMKLMANPKKFERDPDGVMHKEVWEEARFLVLMEHNRGLNKAQKIALLKREKFYPQIDKRDDRIFVEFVSSAAPECDSFVYWD